MLARRFFSTAMYVVAFAVIAMHGDDTFAVPAQVDHADDSQCDILSIPKDVDEIGDAAIFPAGEELDSRFVKITFDSPCPQQDITNVDNVIVEITNLNPWDLAEVWYVASDTTDITNYDGFADDFLFPIGPNNRGHEAFRIDDPNSDPGGIHHPLVFESATQDGIWESGETWHFILQDYTNVLGLPPEAIDSIGVGSASVPGTPGGPPSSGSIIAIVPEPATVGLGCLGFLILGIRRRPTRRGLSCARTTATSSITAPKGSIRGAAKLLPMFLVATFVFSTNLANAAPITIVKDTFSRGDPNNLAPVVGSMADTGQTWTGTGNFQTDGTQLIVNSNNAPRIDGLSLQPGKTYYLSLDVNVTSGGAGWISFGFSSATTGNNAFTASPLKMLHRQQANVEVFNTTGSTPALNSNVPNLFPKTLQICLDIGQNPVNSTATFFAGSQIGGTFPVNASTIGGIFIQANDGQGTVDNFCLTCIPEPGTMVLASLGLLTVGFRRRRPRRLPLCAEEAASPRPAFRGSSRAVSSVCLLVCLIASEQSAQAVTFDWATVGNPGNNPYVLQFPFDPLIPSSYGGVNYAYRIAKHEVTNSQYVKFLNAVDANGVNPNSLFNTLMETSARGGIMFNSGASSGSKYSVKSGRGQNPVVFVSHTDAYRFVNWLQNGKPTNGTGTEQGVYTISPSGNEVRSPSAKYFLPTEDEWTKAAYYDSGNANYFTYPMQTNTIPFLSTNNAPPGGPISANFRGCCSLFAPNGKPSSGGDKFAKTGSNVYNDAFNYLTDVGAYTTATSPYGTFDQGGNVREMLETSVIDNLQRPNRFIWGGFWSGDSDALEIEDAGRTYIPVSASFAVLENDRVGFRVASAIPEPSCFALLMSAISSVICRRRNS